jgi:GAG-pre-integrase domain
MGAVLAVALFQLLSAYIAFAPANNSVVTVGTAIAFWVALLKPVAALSALPTVAPPPSKTPHKPLSKHFRRRLRRLFWLPKPNTHRKQIRWRPFRTHRNAPNLGKPPTLKPWSDPLSHGQAHVKPLPTKALFSHGWLLRFLPMVALFHPSPLSTPSVFTASPTPVVPSAVSVDRLRASAARKTSLLHNADSNKSFIWDTGASFSVSPYKEDFVNGVEPLVSPIHLTGLAKGLKVDGIGCVHWTVALDNGETRTLLVHAYFVPGSNARLLSPQSYIQCWAREHGGVEPTSSVSGTAMSFTWPNGNRVTAPFARNNLPTTDILDLKAMDSEVTQLHLCVTDESNQNLSEAQKELLRWHFRLGHANFDSIKLLLRSGSLASSEGARSLHRAAAKCATPKCASCQYGKMKRRPAPGRLSKPDDSTGNLSKNDLFPGQHVSVDHFICGTEGRLYDSKGRSPKERMYTGGCIFIDHATSFVHVEHQVSLTTHDTLLAKCKFEEVARDSGVAIQRYQMDNGSAFTSGEFTKEMSTFKQIQRFAGVGAHHHNGIAERSIQTIMSMARTMMLHAAIRWPETADSALWPMAVDYAVYIHNHLPNSRTGLSPIDLFTHTRWPTHKCQDLQVWGCPTYVLDSKMQNGQKLPRWSPRSRRAMFVGLSKRHASTAPLVLNLDTLYISPQFHVVFDSWFSTVTADPESVPGVDHPIWTDLFGGSRFQYPFDDDYNPPPLGDEWNRHNANQERADSVRAAQDNAAPPAIPLDQNPPLQPPIQQRTPAQRSTAPRPIDGRE